MKLLFRISFVFVIALFASIGVKAQYELAPLLKPVTLKLDLDTYINFTYENGQSVNVPETNVTITASGRWTLSVTTTDVKLTSGTNDYFDLNKVTLGGFVQGTFGGVCKTFGENSTTGIIKWNLEPLGNIRAGKYEAEVIFTLMSGNN